MAGTENRSRFDVSDPIWNSNSNRPYSSSLNTRFAPVQAYQEEQSRIDLDSSVDGKNGEIVEDLHRADPYFITDYFSRNGDKRNISPIQECRS